jgi:aminoglycoside phosphotransferase (APT) family kinase protein
MRTDIYYRKCDNPLSIEEKLIYNDKYKLADITELVKAIAVHHFGTEPVSIEPTGATGNHYSYYISYPDKTYFFRSDDGKIEDDYMDAEKVAIELAKQHGVPVPEVTTTDTSKQYFPVRYQLMGKVPGQSMKVFFQDGSLNKDKVSKDLGRYLANLHSVKADGFGFINTKVLREDKKII